VRAKAKLGAEHYERLDKAQSLVIANAVELQDDGSATVTSATKADPSVTAEYAVTPKTCTCPDHTVGKATDGLCKHILALMIYRRAVTQWQELLDSTVQQAVPGALPEAPISICLKGTLHGIPGSLVTLRGHSMADIAARADEVRAAAGCLAGMFDDSGPVQPQQPDKPAGGASAGRKRSEATQIWCEADQSYFMQFWGDDGRSWISHKHRDGSWHKHQA
jgi:hypothetical protein